jgi:6-phosphofructokinase 1
LEKIMPAKPKRIGILTAGGDSPGLNAAIRGVGKTAIGFYSMEIIGFRDGFRGIVEDSRLKLDKAALAGILTVGGTILGTSRDKPHRMMIDGRMHNMTETIVKNYKKFGLDALVCLGGGGTQKNALRLHQAGLNVVTLPKTIDNDVSMTDATFGFATAMDIATETIDRLHSTAHSHHRIIVAEIMGHRAGWLTLGAGIAGGADVILKSGTNFSIVAVAEGAMDKEDARAYNLAEAAKEQAKNQKEKHAAKVQLATLEARHIGNTTRLVKHLEELTHLESRLTILGYVQRGGTPSAADRLLATRLGCAAVDAINKGIFGVMIASKGENTEPVPLEKVAGKRKVVPPDHSWVQAARRVGTCMGD